MMMMAMIVKATTKMATIVKDTIKKDIITKDIIINKFKTYIEENKKLMEEIAVLCEKYYLLEVEDNEENNC